MLGMCLKNKLRTMRAAMSDDRYAQAYSGIVSVIFNRIDYVVSETVHASLWYEAWHMSIYYTRKK